MSESTARPVRRPWVRWLLYVVGAFALVTLGAWLMVPPIVRSQLESRLTAALGRPTTVEAVSFNPFELRLTVRKLAIADGNAARPIFAFDELVADLSAASIWHRAPVLDALRITRPTLSLARDGDGRLNAQDLIESAMAPSPEPLRFSLNNIEIDDGSIAFDDGVTGRKHSLAALNVGIPFLSSLPYQTDIRVTPRISGTFNGARFGLGGSTEPFAQRPEATLDIDLEALALPAYVVYLPVKPPIELASGTLTTHFTIAFVGGKPGEQRLELRGDARVDGLALKRADGSPLAAAERVAVAIDRIDLQGDDARITSVAIDAPVVDVTRGADGTLEWARLVAAPPPSSAKPAPAGTRPPAAAPAAARAPPWAVSIGKLAIARGSIALADQASGFQSTLVDVALDASNLTTKPGEKAHLKVAFVSADRIASFSGEADVEPIVPTASGHFVLSKFSLGLLFPYYQSALAVDVQKGSLDYASAFALDAAGNLRLSGGEAAIADLRLAVPGNRDPLWRVPQLVAREIDVDVAARSVAVGSVDSRGAVLRLVRESDGTLEAARLVRTTASTGTTADTGTWTLLAKKFAIDRVAIDLEDRVPQPPVKLALRDFSATVTDYTNTRGGKSGIALKSRVGERGRLSFTGPITTNPFSLDGRVEATGLGLVALKAYVEPRVNVVFTDGALAAKGRMSIDVAEGAPVRAAWKGSLAVTHFAALDKPTSSDLARWQSLTLDGLDVEATPFRASVDRVVLEDFYARAIVYPDGSLNLTRLLTPGASPEPSPDAKPPPAEAATPGEPPPVSIGRIEFARGNVNFSDFFIKPNYSSNLTDVTGSVTAMSPEQAGDVAITARIERTAPVEISGRIHPFAKELSLDILAKAHDVDLPPLTPYSSKYAGYGITKGKLAFDVHYQVENRKLAAENRVVLDQLTFGERVESPSATRLPVLLAVALLKDSHGVIDVRLPISGSLDDPQFSVGGLIIRVIVNLITKAATAPFALLSAAFGHGEELSTVTFAAGSAAIGDDAQKRLDTLGKALADRPALKLDVGGRADPVADGEALRHASVEAAIRREKMKSLAAAGTAPASVDEVTIGADERTRWLTAAYREAPLPDRPRNVVGMLKDLPPAEMEAMLYANAKVDDEALRSLANARARAVKEAIAAKGVADERLFLTAPRLGEGADGGAATSAPPPATRVDLALR
jgi:hypothetical protein